MGCEEWCREFEAEVPERENEHVTLDHSVRRIAFENCYTSTLAGRGRLQTDERKIGMRKHESVLGFDVAAPH